MLDKTRSFRKTLGRFNEVKKLELNLPEATPEQLKAIAENIKRSQSQVLKKQLLVFLLVLITLYPWFAL